MEYTEIKELVRKALREILSEEPGILIEVLVSRPELLEEALIKIAPWSSILRSIRSVKRSLRESVTKKELEELRRDIVSRRDLEELRSVVTKDLEEMRREMATKRDLEEMRNAMATRKDLEEIRGIMATRKDLEEIRSIMATKKELEEIRREMATKRELEEIKSMMATKKDLEELRGIVATKKDLEELRRFVQIRLDALGARWGVLNEEAFREGVSAILREAGYTIRKWIYLDKEGYVYGHPSTIDIDVVIRDDVLILVEITSSIKRGEYNYVKRKAELYEKVEGKKPARIFVITPYIDDKDPNEIILRAREIGIEIITPEEFIERR